VLAEMQAIGALEAACTHAMNTTPVNPAVLAAAQALTTSPNLGQPGKQRPGGTEPATLGSRLSARK
jgi:hypothetical protein